jgi:hypothetical protein
MIKTGFGDLSSLVNAMACFSSHARAMRIRIPQLDLEICLREEICLRCVKEICKEQGLRMQTSQRDKHERGSSRSV